MPCEECIDWHKDMGKPTPCDKCYGHPKVECSDNNIETYSIIVKYFHTFNNGMNGIDGGNIERAMLYSIVPDDEWALTYRKICAYVAASIRVSNEEQQWQTSTSK